jgi:hypothetical protein
LLRTQDRWRGEYGGARGAGLDESTTIEGH